MSWRARFRKRVRSSYIMMFPAAPVQRFFRIASLPLIAFVCLGFELPDDGSTHVCEVQLNLISMLAAKKASHGHYEAVRSALPALCRESDLEAMSASEISRAASNNNAHVPRAIMSLHCR